MSLDLTASGNVSVWNLAVGSQLTCTSGISTSTVSVTGDVSVTGNVRANGLTITGSSSPLAVSSGGTGLSASGTSGYALRSDGSNWTSAKLGLGMTGETWTGVSKSQNVTYYAPNYPIQVQGNFGCNGGGQGYIVVNGTLISFWQAQFNGCGGYSVNMPVIVPPNQPYYLTGMGGGARGWYELI